MNLREFRHQIDMIYAAYVSIRASSEDHDDIIHVAFDDGEYEPIPIAEVYFTVTDDGQPVMMLASPKAASNRAAALEDVDTASDTPAPSVPEATAKEKFDPFVTPPDGYVIPTDDNPIDVPKKFQ